MQTEQPRSSHRDVLIDTGEEVLSGVLDINSIDRGIVVVPDGEDSRRSRQLATALRSHGLGTLVTDLRVLSDDPAGDRRSAPGDSLTDRGQRLVGVIHWLLVHPRTRNCRLGLFAEPGGGAAAIYAAAVVPESIFAVVSRGGWMEVGTDTLAEVRAPTLFITGNASNLATLDLNGRDSADPGNAHLTIVQSVENLGEDRHLNALVELAARWFQRHLASH